MDRIILNITQHSPTGEQAAQGVVDFLPSRMKKVRELLTFTELPNVRELEKRAEKISQTAETECLWREVLPQEVACMIGGAPFFMEALSRSLRSKGFTVLFAFSKRVSREETLLSGETRKVSVFKFEGFIEV